MPQINIFHFLSQTSWTILLFLLFFYTMKQFILPNLLEVIRIKSFLLLNHNNLKFNNSFNYLNYKF